MKFNRQIIIKELSFTKWYIFIVIASLFLSQCSKDVLKLKNTEIEEDIEQRAFLLVNDYRVSQGLDTLLELTIVYEQSQIHSNNMARGKVDFSHDGFDKRVETIKEHDPTLKAFAENVAFNKGYEDPALNAVEGWIESEGHRINMEGNFTHTGLAAISNDKGEVFYTQIFAR